MHLYYARFLCHFCKDQGLVAHRYSTHSALSAFAVHVRVCMLINPLCVIQGAFSEAARPGSDQGPDFQTGGQRPVRKERRNRLHRYTLPECAGCLSVWHICNSRESRGLPFFLCFFIVVCSDINTPPHPFCAAIPLCYVLYVFSSLNDKLTYS